MNHYELRVAAKRERYAERADKLSAESNARYSQARTMASAIPFGQPIQIGHHSEKGDRNYRSRIRNNFAKSFALQSKAAHYAEKAESYGTHAISSDDPDAPDKLREKLAKLQANQALMVAANKAIRSKKDVTAKLVALGLGNAVAEQLQKGDRWTIGFQSYQLSNNNANMKRIEARIKSLEAVEQLEDATKEYEGFTFSIMSEDKRYAFKFPGRPDEETRSLLKSNGFKWSPTREAWVRQITGNALFASKIVRQALLAKVQA